MALDAETGELRRYCQSAPGETHDPDDVFEDVLIDHRGRPVGWNGTNAVYAFALPEEPDAP